MPKPVTPKINPSNTTVEALLPPKVLLPDIAAPDRDVVEDSVNSDVENTLFGETLPSRSFVSRALFSYDVPEVKNLQASFVYNYFTRDERVRKYISPEDQMVNIDSANTSDIFYQVKNDQLPRFVKFSFKPARDPHAKLANKITTIVRDNLDKLIIEGAGSTEYHTGLELLDTNLERTIYQSLSGSFTFIQAVTDKDSPKSAVEKLEATLRESGGLTGKSKKFMLDAMTNIQATGASFAPSDVPPEIAQTANDPLTKQTFSLKFNNLFVGDLINAATRIPDKVFQDEIESLRTIADDIQGSVIRTISPTKVSDAEFENAVPAITSRPFDKVKDKEILESNHEVTQLGYIIQRTEILPDETAVALEPLFADNPDTLYVIDKNVRYGGVYVYKVRTVCKVKSLIRDNDIKDPVYDELSVVEFLMASEGVTTSVNCVETTPPPPPVRVRARLEPRLKKPVVMWQFPLNKQRDIKRFQIFKRQNINSPFTLVREYDFDDSMIRTEPVEVALPERIEMLQAPLLSYFDEEYQVGEKPIYAIACVDAHGYSSHLSAQLEVTYNRFRNMLISRVVSGEGAPKSYPNLLLEEDAFEDAIKTSGHDRMTVFFDPEYYRVVKNLGKVGMNVVDLNKDPVEIDQNFLMVNPDEPTYKIQILNVDLQQDQIVDIRLADKSGPPHVSKAANISRNNINFEFGVE